MSRNFIEAVAHRRSYYHLDNRATVDDNLVVGLMDDIRIIDTPELEQYLANYVDKYWPQAIKK